MQEIMAEYVIMLSAPAGTPPAIANLLANTARSIVQEQEFQQQSLEPLGLEPIGSTAAEALHYSTADRPVQRERIKVSGARLD